MSKKIVVVSECIGSFDTDDQGRCFSFKFDGVYKGHKIDKISGWDKSSTIDLMNGVQYVVGLENISIFGTEIVGDLQSNVMEV